MGKGRLKMASIEELQEKLERMKARLKDKISVSKDPSIDRDVRMARKKVKRIQRRLRVLMAKHRKAKDIGGLTKEPSQKATKEV
jgi:hypothetical protein